MDGRPQLQHHPPNNQQQQPFASYPQINNAGQAGQPNPAGNASFNPVFHQQQQFPQQQQQQPRLQFPPGVQPMTMPMSLDDMKRNLMMPPQAGQPQPRQSVQIQQQQALQAFLQAQQQQQIQPQVLATSTGHGGLQQTRSPGQPASAASLPPQQLQTKKSFNLQEAAQPLRQPVPIGRLQGSPFQHNTPPPPAVAQALLASPAPSSPQKLNAAARQAGVAALKAAASPSGAPPRQLAAGPSRRPSVDEIALMKRLTELAAKGGLPINPLFTKTHWQQQLDGATPLPTIPDFTELEARNVKSWMKKDLRATEMGVKEKQKRKAMVDELYEDVLNQHDWLGLPKSTDLPQTMHSSFRIRGSKQMSDELKKGKRKTRPWLEFSKKQLKTAARQEECLIPIRIDLEQDGRKFTDTFTWNLNEPLIDPSTFASILCEDMLLPPREFHPLIVASINEQIKQFTDAEESHPRSLFLGTSSQPAENDGIVDLTLLEDVNGGTLQQSGQESKEDWWEGWRKRVKVAADVEAGEQMENLEWPADSDQQAVVSGNEDLRILIQLDISVDAIHLQDQFEWDLAEPSNSPEVFAEVYCQDLGLPGEWRTSISHLIREQIDAHSRSLSSIRHIRGDTILHDELSSAFLPPMTEPLRSEHVEAWTPHLETLSFVDLDAREKERQRESRRQKRGARIRRSAVALPDREPQRTCRTLMPKPGAKLELSESQASHNRAANDGDADMDGISNEPSYEVARGYAIVTSAAPGPPPQTWSPLRRHARLKGYDAAALSTTTINGELAALTGQKGPKKRGRPFLTKEQREQREAAKAGLAGSTSTYLDVDGGTPPPDGSPAVSFSPAPGSTVGRKPLKRGRPKKPQITVYPNIIDGKWHCTNCGVPEPIAVGRRKGPGGEKTQCAECGKYWMSNKGRARPCEYTIDSEYHRARAESLKLPVVGGANDSSAGSRLVSEAPTPTATLPPDSPGGSEYGPDSDQEYKPEGDSFDDGADVRPRGDSDASSRGGGYGYGGGSLPPKPMGLGKGKGKGLPPPPAPPSTSSSSSRGQATRPPSSSASPDAAKSVQPLSQPTSRLNPSLMGSPPALSTQLSASSLPTIKLSPHLRRPQLPGSPSDTNVNSLGLAGSPPPNSPPTSQTVKTSPGYTRPVAPPRKRLEAPQWLTAAVATLQSERPDDRFEIAPKPRTDPSEALEWRLKCLDCPGKVYKTGPAETLNNFTSHLKFKGHRSAVTARMAKVKAEGAGSP